MHDFHTFRSNPAALKFQTLVTIQRRGAISLNSAAHEALGSPAAVELLYDPKERIVGLRPANPRLRHAYTFRTPNRSNNGPFVISASAFSNYYDIDTTTAHRWVAYLDDGVLCVDLKSEGVPVTSNRAHDASDAQHAGEQDGPASAAR